VTDSENPAMKEMQPTDPDAAIDRVVADAEREQLPAGHDAVLIGRVRGDFQVSGG
jgi:hypothetical protein